MCVCIYILTYQALSISFPVNFHSGVSFGRSVHDSILSSQRSAPFALAVEVRWVLPSQTSWSDNRPFPRQNAKGLPTWAQNLHQLSLCLLLVSPLYVMTHSDLCSSVFLRCCQVTDDPAILYFSSRASGGFAHHLQVPHAHIIAHQAQFVFQNVLRSQSTKLLGMQCWDAHRFGDLVPVHEDPWMRYSHSAVATPWTHHGASATKLCVSPMCHLASGTLREFCLVSCYFGASVWNGNEWPEASLIDDVYSSIFLGIGSYLLRIIQEEPLYKYIEYVNYRLWRSWNCVWKSFHLVIHPSTSSLPARGSTVLMS